MIYVSFRRGIVVGWPTTRRDAGLPCRAPLRSLCRCCFGGGCFARGLQVFDVIADEAERHNIAGVNATLDAELMALVHVRRHARPTTPPPHPFAYMTHIPRQTRQRTGGRTHACPRTRTLP